MTLSTGTVLRAPWRILACVRAAGDGISASTLSVEISSSGSSRPTVSPTFFIQREIVPSAIDSPICGITTSTAMVFPHSGCSSIPAHRARGSYDNAVFHPGLNREFQHNECRMLNAEPKNEERGDIARFPFCVLPCCIQHSAFVVFGCISSATAPSPRRPASPCWGGGSLRAEARKARVYRARRPA